MGAVILRAQTCLTCGGPLPTTGRVDRRYCKGACRTLAYRVRRRIKATRPPGPLEPAWSEPNAVVKTMLTSLAQIQARVLDFAHQLEHEEFYARAPVRTAAPAAPAAGSDEQHPAADIQTPLFDDLSAQAVRREADADGTVVTRSVDLPAASLPRSSPMDAATSTRSVDLAARLDEVIQQRDKLHTELLAERESRGKLAAQLKTLNKEASEAIGQLKDRQKHLQRERDALVLRVQELKAQLERASQTLTTWELAGSQSMEIAARSDALQQENALLRAEVKRLRPPSADADPLVLLMIDRVKALHWLAVYEKRRGVKMTGQLLPSYENEHILAAAQYQAFCARRDFYFRTRGPHQPAPSWVKEDQLLDPASEKKLCDDAQYNNRGVCNRLEFERRSAGEHP